MKNTALALTVFFLMASAASAIWTQSTINDVSYRDITYDNVSQRGVMRVTSYFVVDDVENESRGYVELRYCTGDNDSFDAIVDRIALSQGDPLVGWFKLILPNALNTHYNDTYSFMDNSTVDGVSAGWNDNIFSYEYHDYTDYELLFGNKHRFSFGDLLSDAGEGNYTKTVNYLNADAALWFTPHLEDVVVPPFFYDATSDQREGSVIYYDDASGIAGTIAQYGYIPVSTPISGNTTIMAECGTTSSTTTTTTSTSLIPTTTLDEIYQNPYYFNFTLNLNTNGHAITYDKVYAGVFPCALEDALESSTYADLVAACRPSVYSLDSQYLQTFNSTWNYRGTGLSASTGIYSFAWVKDTDIKTYVYTPITSAGDNGTITETINLTLPMNQTNRFCFEFYNVQDNTFTTQLTGVSYTWTLAGFYKDSSADYCHNVDGYGQSITITPSRYGYKTILNELLQHNSNPGSETKPVILYPDSNALNYTTTYSQGLVLNETAELPQLNAKVSWIAKIADGPGEVASGTVYTDAAGHYNITNVPLATTLHLAITDEYNEYVNRYVQTKITSTGNPDLYIQVILKRRVVGDNKRVINIGVKDNNTVPISDWECRTEPGVPAGCPEIVLTSGPYDSQLVEYDPACPYIMCCTSNTFEKKCMSMNRMPDNWFDFTLPRKYTLSGDICKLKGTVHYLNLSGTTTRLAGTVLLRDGSSLIDTSETTTDREFSFDVLCNKDYVLAYRYMGTEEIFPRKVVSISSEGESWTTQLIIEQGEFELRDNARGFAWLLSTLAVFVPLFFLIMFLFIFVVIKKLMKEM